MRMSCNGCRVLRKGCSENCSIRPCLQWIKTPESQANATVFLAKFYGRAGLMNLINSGPEHLRPAIFRSLLYEACGRIVNPIYGSVGLLWSGSWQLCQAAVEAVLKGTPIMQISSEVAAISPSPPLKAYDIRHVSKDENSSAASQELHKVKTRSRFKRSGAGKAANNKQVNESNKVHTYLDRAPSHESSVSHQTELNNGEGCSRETESMFSVETVEASLVNRADPEPVPKFDNFNGSDADDNNNDDVELELTLGFEPSRREKSMSPKKWRDEINNSYTDTCKIEVGIDYAV
ncbi:hypothetical protein AQUCO_02600293v1 [Aquilegia coerulea]|uniref:LOB domain-containing protein n=1 Tax=Aquilegia coerulea TaxID=218851 RepID=A0A2G5D898_AQUCA|nr:hypothetical protein AQUCO_02600293v1 [Aquilegia coerulea]